MGILIPFEKLVHNKELLGPKFFIITSQSGKAFKALLPPRHSMVIKNLKFWSGPGDLQAGMGIQEDCSLDFPFMFA